MVCGGELLEFEYLAGADLVAGLEVVELAKTSGRHTVGSGDGEEGIAFLDGVGGHRSTLLVGIFLLGKIARGLVVARLCIGVLGEGVGVGVGTLIAEVDDGCGIDGVAHVASLKVEVRTCAAAGVATEGDRLTGFHYLVGFYKKLIEVTVYSLQAVGVAHDDIVAIAACLVVGEAYFAVEGCADGVVATDAKVDTFVHTSEFRAVAIAGGHGTLVGHRKTGDIDHHAVGHILLAKRIYTLRIPTLGIDIELRLDIIDEVDKCIFVYKADLVLVSGLIGQQLSVCLRVAAFALGGSAQRGKSHKGCKADYRCLLNTIHFVDSFVAIRRKLDTSKKYYPASRISIIQCQGDDSRGGEMASSLCRGLQMYYVKMSRNLRWIIKKHFAVN